MTDQAPAPLPVADAPLRQIRRGHFWIPGERLSIDGATVQRGPLFVYWEAPAAITRPYPLVLVHGGGGQGTDWCGTPDGRAGWLDRFVDDGYLVYVVDRPGHGRSWAHPDVLGAPGPQLSYEVASVLFASHDGDGGQAPWTSEIGDPIFDQLVASSGFILADLAESQRLDQAGLAALLNRVGPSILVTHSAGGPAGWLAADARPGLVKGIVAIEPMGPPFAELAPGMRLAWGLTAAPIGASALGSTDEPPRQGDRVSLPYLASVPTVVVAAAASPLRGSVPDVVQFLVDAGVPASVLDLAAENVLGNGHAPMLERNSDLAIVPILTWLAEIGADPASVSAPA